MNGQPAVTTLTSDGSIASAAYGVHRCAGGYLAQLEMESLLRAMVERVQRIEVGEPVILMNNMLRGYASFSAAFR